MLISIIVPVYNALEYLDKCLESISSQTYTDFEVILIDNGSTDGSYSKCAEYAGKDSRFKIFQETEKGVSFARNKGLRNAAGVYVTFVDSDDFISENYLEALVGAAKGGADIVFGGFSLWYSEKRQKPVLFPYKSGEYCGGDKKYLFDNGFICAKLIKRSVIAENGIVFNGSLHLAEDMIFIQEAVVCSSRAVVIDDIVYYYRQGRSGQATSASNSEINIRSKISAYMDIMPKLYEKHNVNDIYKPYADKKVAGIFIGDTFAASEISKISRKAFDDIFSPRACDILKISLCGDVCPQWMIKWFSYFRFWASKGNGGGYLFLKFMRVYRNLILKPFKIKP